MARTYLHLGLQDGKQKVVSQAKIDITNTSREDTVEKLFEALNALFDQIEEGEYGG